MTALRAAVADLVAAEVSGLDATEAGALYRELKVAGDQVQVVAARVLAQVEADGRWSAGDSRTFGEWVSSRSLGSVSGARREAELGRALGADLPVTASAVAAGQITLEHAQVLARFAPTSEVRRAALAGGGPGRDEAFLVEQATRLPADRYRRLVQQWAAGVDQAAAERGHEVACAKEYLTVTRRDDGMALQGFLTTEHGVVLLTALRAVTGVPGTGDERSHEERQGAALADLARVVLDRGLVGGGQQVRPHLSVHVPWETMQRLAEAHPSAAGTGSDSSAPGGLVEPAVLESGEPIPTSLLERIACDSEVTRIVFGPHSQVLDVGRAHRTYSGQLRRAIIARDRHCQYPGCQTPPHLGEVHHCTSWAHGGATSVTNGILLCWYHHDLVHRRRTTIETDAGHRWIFRRPDGTIITSPSPASAAPPGGASPGSALPGSALPGRAPRGSALPGRPLVDRTGGASDRRSVEAREGVRAVPEQLLLPLGAP